MNPFIQQWRQVTQERGWSIAIRCFQKNSATTFDQIETASNQCLSTLRQFMPRIESGIVAFQIRDPEHWLATFLAILKAGAIAMPVDANATEFELNRICTEHPVALRIRESDIHSVSDRRIRSMARAGIGLIKLTSGTSATPKALPFTLEQMICDAENILRSMGIGPSDSQFATIPLGHSYGLGSLVFPFFLKGIPLAFGSMLLPSIIAKELEASRSSVWPTVPAILSAIAHSDSIHLPSTLRLIVSAASPLSTDVANLFHQRFGLKIHNFYGSSETGGVAWDDTGDRIQIDSSVGIPLSGVKVRISPSGRILVESGAVHTFRNRRHNKSPHTHLLSDKGYFRHETLILTGRSDRIIKHNGKRINLAQIESIMMECPNIIETWVGYDCQRHRLIAAVSGIASVSSLASFLALALPEWKRPKLVWLIERMPTTPRGKPDHDTILKQTLSKGIPVVYP